MKSSRTALVVTTGLLLALGSVGGARAASLSAQDQQFVMKAGHGGAAEVADAKLALTHTTNPNVLAFAHRMITDHGMANQQLASIAGMHGTTPPMMGNAMQMQEHVKLASLHGSAFDSAYLSSEKTAHEKTIALFQQEAASGSAPKLVAFAKMTLPKLDSHLAMDEKALSSSM